MEKRTDIDLNEYLKNQKKQQKYMEAVFQVMKDGMEKLKNEKDRVQFEYVGGTNVQSQQIEVFNKNNITNLRLYDEEGEDYDLDEINDFIVEKITPIVKEKLETVIENDNEKEGMIFKPVIDEFKDNTRNEFIDFDNVISKFRTVLERDLKNNKEKEKEEEFEK